MMSLTTCLLNVAGNVTRIFTTLVLTKDPYILSACTTQFCLNSILLWQVWKTRVQQRVAAKKAAAAAAAALQAEEEKERSRAAWGSGGGTGEGAGARLHGGGVPSPQAA